jgi:uncharacterized protein
VLLDESWCAFLRENGFLVGLSIDGPTHLHDSYRVDRQGKSTHAAVVLALQLLQAERVEFNTKVCVHRVNGVHGAVVYSYLRDIGCRYMQFIPIVQRRGAGRHAEATGSDAQPEVFTINSAEEAVSSRSVLPGQFGRFLISVFDEWIRQDVGKVFVRNFDESLAMWTGLESSLCIFRRECGESLIIEHNGDVYSCDHEVRFACNGECPKNRFLVTPDGATGLNYLCEGYRSFFHHIDPTMRRMAAAIQSQAAP